jgi:Tfp pilus assembly protein PilF
MNRVLVILTVALWSCAAGAGTGEAQSHYRRGREALSRGDAAAAVTYFENAVAADPDNAAYHYQLANAYAQAGVAAGMLGRMSYGKKAKAEWERAVESDPNFIPARLSLIEFHVLAPAVFGGSEEEAKTQAAEIRKRDPIEGRRAFARLHTAAKRPDLARGEYLQLVKEYPKSARARYLFGVYLTATEKNHAAAAAEFELAARLDPSYMPAYFQIGHVAAVAATNFARGEEALRKYLSHSPKEDEPSIARAHYWLGVLYEKQGKQARARASYAESLKLNPNQKDAVEASKRLLDEAGGPH